METSQSQKNIPPNWQQVKLADIGEFKNGVNKSKDDFGHGFPFVNLMDIFGFSSIKNKDFSLVNVNVNELENYNLKKGDVLFVRSSVKPEGVGLATLVEEDLKNTVYSGFIIRFRTKSGLLIDKFKKFVFQSPYFRNNLIASSSVSANTNINQDSLNKLTIKLPPIEEQNRIVSVLETWDKAIEKLSKKIEVKKQIKKGLMQDLLTGKKRLKGFSDQWEIKKLGDVSIVKKGDSITKKDITAGNIPVIAGGQQPAYYHNQSNRTGKTITVSASGAYAGYIDYYNQPIFVSDCTSIKEKDVDIDFVYLYLKLKQQYIYSLQSGGAQPHVQPKDLQSVKIEFPKSKEEQKAIAKILTTTDNEIQELEKKLQIIKEQKKYLLNNLVTGTIRTPETLSTKLTK